MTVNRAKNKDVGFQYPVGGTVLISLLEADKLAQDCGTRLPDLCNSSQLSMHERWGHIANTMGNDHLEDPLGTPSFGTAHVFTKLCPSLLEYHLSMLCMQIISNTPKNINIEGQHSQVGAELPPAARALGEED